jgi:hypothetical protein
MRLSRNVVIILGLLSLTACGRANQPNASESSVPAPSRGPSASAEPGAPVDVELGLSSGMPDPRWTLTTEQAETLDTLLARLPDGTGTPPAGGLGYHGFTILLPASPLVVYQGVVAPPGDGARTVKADPTRSVERYLLETSRPHVPLAEYAEVERALARP